MQFVTDECIFFSFKIKNHDEILLIVVVTQGIITVLLSCVKDRTGFKKKWCKLSGF
jgi:hypothetical protein